MRIFLNLFLYLAIAAFSPLSLADDMSCDGIVKAKEGDSLLTPEVVEGKEYLICEQDFSMISLNLMFNKAFNTDTTVQWLYDLLGAPAPNQKGSYEMVSGLIDMTAYTVSSLFFKVFLPIFVVVMIALSVKMANGANAKDLLKDKTVWTGAGALLIFAILIYPVDKYMLGQALIVGAAILSIKLGLFALSSVIEIFDFEAVAGKATSNAMFDASSKIFANELIAEASAGRASTLRLNREGLNATEREVIVDGGAVVRQPRGGEFGSSFEISLSEFISGWNDYRDDEPTTNESYAIQSLTQSLITIKVPPVLTKDANNSAGNVNERIQSESFSYTKSLSYGQSLENKNSPITFGSLANYKGTGRFVSDSDSDHFGVFTPYATEPTSIDEIYQTSELSKSEFPLMFAPPKPEEKGFFKTATLETGSAKDMVEDLYQKELHGVFSYPSGVPTKSSTDSFSQSYESLASSVSKLVEPAAAFSKAHYSDDTAVQGYIQSAAPFLIGYGNFQGNTGNRYGVHYFTYNPNNIDAFTSGNTRFAKTMLYGMMRDAHAASFEAAKFSCLNMMEEVNSADMTNVVSQIYLYLAATDADKKGEKIDRDNAPINHSSQCLAYDSNGLKILLPDGLVNAAKELIEKEDVEANLLREALVHEVANYKDDKIKAAEMVALYRDRIAVGMSNIQKLVTQSINHQATEESSKDLSLDVLNSMRAQGLTSVVGYFAKVSQELSSRLIGLKNSQVIAGLTTYVLDDEMHPPFSENKVIDDEEGDQMEILFSSTGLTLKEILNGKGSAASLVHGGAPSTSTSIDMSFVVDEVVDIALLEQSILSFGFGLGDGKEDDFVEGLKKCADGSCYKFVQHPIITLSLYGSEMLFTGGIIMILSTFGDIITEGISTIADVIGDMGSLLGGIVGPLGKVVGFLSGTLVGIVADVFIVTFKVVIALVAPIGTLYMVLGLLMCFMLPIIPIVGYLMMWVMWLLEVAMVFVFFPVFAMLHIIKIDKRRLLPSSRFAGLFLSIILKPLLFLMSFVLFYSLTYIAVYLVNSMAGVMLANFSDVGIFGVFMEVISMMIILYLYYKCLVKIYSSTQEVPNRILSYIGVQGFDVGGISNGEQLVGSIGVAAGVQGAMDKAGRKVADKSVKKAAAEAREGTVSELQEALEGKGIDVRASLEEFRMAKNGGGKG